MIDFDPKKIPRQPENVIIVPEYKGDPSDKELYYLLPFLKSKYSP
jgi:import inner membrane translocase subunit TIM50